MKILHTVESYLPNRHGMSEVVRQISEYLVKKGHQVTVATKSDINRKNDIINGVIVVSFNITGNYVDGYKGDKSSYIDFISLSNFDVITNFAAQQWATDLCFEILPLLKCRKYFVPTGFSLLYNKRYIDYYNNMPTWMNIYDHNIFLSNNYRDINFARNHDISKIIVIPNGASLEEFNKPSEFNVKKIFNIPKDFKIILHVGSYTGVKGHDEALRIFNKSKLRKSALIFIGENFNNEEIISFAAKVNPFSNFKLKNITNYKTILRWFYHSITNLKFNYFKKYYLFSGKRSEVISLFSQADILLFPSNIECSPLVLFEALASKTPFLVSDVGNSKEIINWTNGGILLPTHKDNLGYSKVDEYKSSLILSNVLNNKFLLNKLKFDGYNNWKSNFTWEKISEMYLNLYSS